MTFNQNAFMNNRPNKTTIEIQYWYYFLFKSSVQCLTNQTISFSKKLLKIDPCNEIWHYTVNTATLFDTANFHGPLSIIRLSIYKVSL